MKDKDSEDSEELKETEKQVQLYIGITSSSG